MSLTVKWLWALTVHWCSAARALDVGVRVGSWRAAHATSMKIVFPSGFAHVFVRLGIPLQAGIPFVSRDTLVVRLTVSSLRPPNPRLLLYIFKWCIVLAQLLAQLCGTACARQCDRCLDLHLLWWA